MKRRITISPKTSTTAKTPKSVTEKCEGNILVVLLKQISKWRFVERVLGSGMHKFVPVLPLLHVNKEMGGFRCDIQEQIIEGIVILVGEFGRAKDLHKVFHFYFHVCQESTDGAVVKGARLPSMWPGFHSTPRHVWVEFVVGSRPCYEDFSPGSPVFLPPQKGGRYFEVSGGRYLFFIMILPIGTKKKTITTTNRYNTATATNTLFLVFT